LKNRSFAAIPRPEDVQSVKLSNLLINPTAEGLIFTFAPYAVDSLSAGSYTVMLPYKTIAKVVKVQSPLGRFLDSPEPVRSASVNP